MMKQSKGVTELIDLSFLSTEEEAVIRQVLLRDEDLKRLESGRVRKLRQAVPDLKRLKSLTGEWFEELKVKRHGQQADVTTVVRSSIRWKKTGGHKHVVFQSDIQQESEEFKKKQENASSVISDDPRLIHPALSAETCCQYADENFTEGVTERSSANGWANDGSVKTRKDAHSTPLSSQSKSGKTANGESEKKLPFPPALQKANSVDENWVKITLEPNVITPDSFSLKNENSPVQTKPVEEEKQGHNPSPCLAEASQDGPSAKAEGKQIDITSSNEATQETEPPQLEHEDVGEPELDPDNLLQRTESVILQNVLERAQTLKERPKSIVLTKSTTQEAQDDAVPTIVIMPMECLQRINTKRIKEEPAEEKSSFSTADVWEDEGVNSDDDSSMSSYGSDQSVKKGGYSASALSLSDRTGSLLSVYSDAGDFGNVVVQGSVEFAMMYSPNGELIIMIGQCHDLALANARKQRTDPYVKTYLYPDKSRRSKRKTSIKKRTVNPVFLESLVYKVTREVLPEKTLNLSVWHNDSMGRNVFLGQVEINLSSWDWENEALRWYNLEPKQLQTSADQESQESHGVLSVSLKYVPPKSTEGSKSSTGEIHVWLREATDLRQLRPQGVDSFVKCYILPDTRRKSRQKTRVVKKTSDPVYNHAMVYDGFSVGEVSEACCELSVWDHNTLSNQFLGGVRLSLGTGQSYGKEVDWMDSLNEEVEIWDRMLGNPNSWVEGELPLRSSMTPRK